MLTVKAKHATMLLTMRDAVGLSEETQELDKVAKTQSQPSVVRINKYKWNCYRYICLFVSLIIFSLGGVRKHIVIVTPTCLLPLMSLVKKALTAIFPLLFVVPTLLSLTPRLHLAWYSNYSMFCSTVTH